MSVKPPLKFGCARLTLAHKSFQLHGILARRANSLSKMGMLGIKSRQARHKVPGSSRNTVRNRGKWNFNLDVERSKDAVKDRQMSLPLMVYLYSPWKMMSTKFNLWKLKILWDWDFNEAFFVDNAKQALVLVTRFIVEKRNSYIKRCSTPMGYKQISYDLLREKKHQSGNLPHELMRFEKRHIRRAIPLRVQRLEHYDHKFAFIDMIFLACRRTNDFTSKVEVEQMNRLVEQHADASKLFVRHPIVFAEVFVRFRRDYSIPPTVRAGHWLISTYKVVNLDLLNFHPDFHVGSGVSEALKSVDPLPQNTTMT
ncbi:uncharacterized protein [Drosophila virilis]|uniref:Uncharacterized protein n=1 Tax=Drosophila virilis TaxID=7244 RepID=B4LPL3_DROVI|nr:uncharacterized protein LOC6625331 [Drosophila virilis]EDW60251.1 uncharacterized protein Dvir_GJ20966 [Drosophila virilis]